jgi:hypothetical protein
MLAAALAMFLAGAPLTDPPYSVDETPAQGLWLGAELGAGFIDHDIVAGTSLGIGVELEPFALHLRVPLELRVVDLPPHVDSTQSAACHVLRCAPWTAHGQLSLASLSRIVDELRVLHPGDLVYVRGGPLLSTLGHGLVVDRYTNGIEVDRRKSGVFVESDLPWAGLVAQAVVGDVLAPQEMFALRVQAQPLGRDDDDAPSARFVHRLRVGLDFGGDAVAPANAAAVDVGGDVVDHAATRPLLSSALDVTWPLLDDGGVVQVAPYVAAAGTLGLSAGGGVQGGVGGGGALGVDVNADVSAVALHLGVQGTLASPGQRFGVFGSFVDVERRRALAGASTDLGPLVRVPAPGGLGLDVKLDTTVQKHVRVGATMHLDPSPGANALTLFTDVATGPVHVAAWASQRAFVDVASLLRVEHSYAVVEAAWDVWSPLSIVARYTRGPRFDGSGHVGPVDDVYVGVVASVVLQAAPEARAPAPKPDAGKAPDDDDSDGE